MNENVIDEKFETIEIRLPQHLLDILKSKINVESKSLSQVIVGLLDQAVFLTPEDLAMINDNALRKANLDQLAEEENAMVAKYNAIIAEIQRATNDLERLKRE